MKNKILWLSILGLAWARPPNHIDSTASNIGEEQKQRTARSIWPFTYSATTTEAPVEYPPALPDNNEWLVQGDTKLPHVIDFNKYPVWKVHKYDGIDLHPINLQPENTYPPELHHGVEPGYSSGSSSSSDFHGNSYQNGYQDFGTYSAGYPVAYSSPPAAYPADQETYQTGEFHSSSFNPPANPFTIQTQQKYEVYAPPQPLKDYGLSNTHHAGSVDYRRNSAEEQKQAFSAGEEKSQTSGGRNPDLSFLDDLGGLAPFLPEPTNEEDSQEAETEAPEEGFFEKLFSRFRGTTEAPAAEVAETEEENPANSGGFLSSVFGFGSDAQPPEVESSVTESSGGLFSSLFYPTTETERPTVVIPTTYYLPKTRGAYIDVKIPTLAAPNYAPSVGPYNDHSIAFHEPPRVPFTHRETLQYSSPTLDSSYHYNSGYSEVRNAGFAGSAISSDYQPSNEYGQPLPLTSKIAAHFTQTHDSKQQQDSEVDEFSSNQVADALEKPHAEYMHSAHNDEESSVPTSSNQQSSAKKYSRASEMRQIQSTVEVPQSEEESAKVYPSEMTSSNADEVGQHHTEKRNQNLNGKEYQNQSFGTTSSNLEGTSNTEDTFDHNLELLSLGQAVNENEPMLEPQISGGFIPSLAYGYPTGAGDGTNFDTDNREYNQQTTSTSENVYDHYLHNSGDAFTQNFDRSSVSSYDHTAQRKREPVQRSVPVYQTPISALQNPSNTLGLTDFGFLPVKEANDFREAFSDQDNENEEARFIKNLSALTSYGTPTNSYHSNSFATAASNVRSIAVPAPTKDEVNDGVSINVQNKDVFRSTLPEQSPTKKVDRVMRKVMKRRNSLESYNSRRSTPERQAPTEEADTSLIIRNETDLIPEVTDTRQFDGTTIIDGYSKVQNDQLQVVAGTARAMTPMNPVLGTVQH